MSEKNSIYNNFAAALKKIIDEKWPKKAYILAQTASVARGTVYNIYNDEQTSITTETMEKLAAACGYSLDDFLNIGAKALGKKRGVTGQQAIKHEMVSIHEKLAARLLNKFDDLDRALELCEMLAKLEKEAPGDFQEVFGFVRGLYQKSINPKVKRKQPGG